MAVTLYAIPLSNAANAARAMIAYKRIDHRLVRLPVGLHPWLLRAAGFAGGTVPALDVDGRRLQSSLAISRAFDELQPERPLFPADPEHRQAVEQAERWGEAELQAVPRRIFRWAVANNPEVGRWLSDEVLGLPFPGLAAALARPVPRHLAAVVGATAEATRQDLAGLPALMDRVDALIAGGIIGGDVPNAADFQVLASVRALGLTPELRGAVAGRPCDDAARRRFPYYDGRFGPLALPREWLTPLS